MKRFAVLLLMLLALPVAAQEYRVPDVTVSKDKVRVDGKTYYAHVVTSKQTLYSISKAYEVTIQEIYDSNRNLDLEKNGLKAGQVILIPTVPQKPKADVPSPAPLFHATQKADTVATGKSQMETAQPETKHVLFPQFRSLFEGILGSADGYTEDIPETINVSILLPFTTAGKTDSKSVDFYSGVLLAARDLGEEGIKININTYDIAGGSLSNSMLASADVIIGPISEKNVFKAAKICPGGKYIISPLDPKITGMADSMRVIQAPTPTLDQATDAVTWAISEMVRGDSLVLIREKGKALQGSSAAILDALRGSGAHWSTISYDILDGMEIQPKFIGTASVRGTTRYLIASEDESFVNDAVRNINLMAYKKQPVVLYGPSRLRSYNTIETENLHNINTHISATYQTDYNEHAVQAFVLAYRALFHSEPNSFAFQGYDTMRYFTGMCARYGRMWFMKLPAESGHGLQTDFAFGKSERAGQVNKAVRRLVYTSDYRIVLQ